MKLIVVSTVLIIAVADAFQSTISLSRVVWKKTKQVKYHKKQNHSWRDHEGKTRKIVQTKEEGVLYMSLQSEDISKDSFSKVKDIEVQDSCQEVCPYNDNPYYLDGTKPNSAFLLATQNFMRQGSALIEQIAVDKFGIVGKSYIPPEEKPPLVFGFTLSNEDVKEAERKRESRPGSKVESNVVARGLYEVGCFVLDELFDERPIARFWFLETIARIPYFSYVSDL